MVTISSDDDYLVLRDALVNDASRDQRIHHWISSQYDFALSELDLDPISMAHSKHVPPSRADSPLLGYLATHHPNQSSSSSLTDAPGAQCPSYDPLFATPHDSSLSLADQEFEEREREAALKFLIEEMHGGRVFPCPPNPHTHREKSLPALPSPPPCTPASSPPRSRAPSHVYTHRRTSRLPSISSTLQHPLAPPTELDRDLPTPTQPRHPAPQPLLASPPRAGLGHKRSRGTLSLSPPLSPALSAPYAYPESPTTPSFSFSSFTHSTQHSPSSSVESAYMTPESTHAPAPAFLSSPADSVCDQEGAARPRLALPAAQPQSRWSLASSLDSCAPAPPAASPISALFPLHASPKAQKPRALKEPAEKLQAPKTPSRRARLRSLISLLTPSAHPVPVPASPASYRPRLPSLALGADGDAGYYAPARRSSDSLSSAASHRASRSTPNPPPALGLLRKKGSLAHLGYARRSLLPAAPSPVPSLAPSAGMKAKFSLGSLAGKGRRGRV